MTVKELIEKLQEFPQDHRVLVDAHDDGGGYEDLYPSQVCLINAILYENGTDRIGVRGGVDGIHGCDHSWKNKPATECLLISRWKSS